MFCNLVNGNRQGINPDRPLKTRKHWWLFVLLVIVLIVPVVLILNKTRQQDRLENKIAEIRAVGQPTTWKELVDWFPKGPEGQNAADLYVKAFEAIVEWDDEKTDYFPVIGGEYDPDRHEPLPEETWKSIAAYLTDNRETLLLLHEAAAHPHCQFLGDTSLSRGAWFSQHMKLFSNARTAAKILCLEAIYQAHTGEDQAATDALLSGFRLTDAFDGVPLLIDWLVQIGVRNLVISKLQRVVNTVQLNDDQLERFINKMQGYLDSESLKQAWTAELGYTLAGLDEFYWLYGAPGTGSTLGDELAYYAYDALGLTETRLLRHIDGMTEMIAAFQPVVQGTKPAMEQLLNQSLQHHSSEEFFEAAMRDPLAQIVQTYTMEQRSCAHMASVLTGLAVERFRLVNQRLPSDLQDLTPSYIEKLPNDPYTGKTLKYKRHEKGYCVYSVGADGIDNGGREKNEKGRSFEPGSDIPFTVADPNDQ